MSKEELENNTISPRKIAANRRNAQRSTGPKTPEGKARSSRNAITHAIFVKQFLSAAAPEAVEEIELLAEALWEHYKPENIVEEIFTQKVVVEATRYGRVLGLEEPELLSARSDSLHCLDLAARYTASTSRALFQAIKELERLQAARKAREGSSSSTAEGPANPSLQADEDPPETQVLDNPASNGTTSEDPKGDAD